MMISMLQGVLTSFGEQDAVIDCGGVGYRVHVPSSVIPALPQKGERCTLFTIFNITKTDVSLVGFLTEEQRSCFQMLTGVSGAGTKAGLTILGALDVQTVYQAIATENAELFTEVKGIGKKLAQRIVLECRDKVEKEFEAQVSLDMQGPAENTAVRTAVEALVSLGYQRKEASAVVKKLDPGLPAETLIAQALRKISF